ncbi:BTB/POZ domain-containing-like protein [Cinnamomum micranthum f. kanehirae]|uniref:BTB/POZ domain-containing-like protein n=1 Tax=Cinnamomum micranthum f. kanehirae TaxID=337451 RepID=A0A443PPY4_9MAGN|nr:BTB/POZ domain-containing-like protein [Cinnamomum micranthum f. kanehirae]
MADYSEYRYISRRKNLDFGRIWCCSFPQTKSPENLSSSIVPFNLPKPHKTSEDLVPKSPSPINNPKLGSVLCPIKRSPGRVSPIDNENLFDSSESDPPPVPASLPPQRSVSSGERYSAAAATVRSLCERDFDVRLDLKGKDGRILEVAMNSEALRSSSFVFEEKIAEASRRIGPGGCFSIEVEDVENVEAFKETIELMCEKDVGKKLMKIGVDRAIDILEVSSIIMFDIGIKSCLNYLEAVPWCENEEEKLKNLFTRCTIDESVAQDVLARLDLQDPVSQPLGLHIVQSVTQGIDMNAKRELKSLVKGLLSTSSVYQKEAAGINKEDLYGICDACLHLLEDCFKEAYDQVSQDQSATRESRRPLIGLISEQVDNLNWLLDILMDKQMAEDFVGLWAKQSELLRVHEKASPMVRYELSRVSACVFIALGRGKLQCRGEERYNVIKAWFGPMLADFGWLQRCSKGLDVKELEEAMGNALLTLPLKHQQILFMEWLSCYSEIGRDCPNLSKAFQVWWRRTFSKAAEA